MKASIHGGKRPTELPAYSIREAAHYLQLPVSTLRSWVVGRSYPTSGGQRRFRQIIEPADRKHGVLSFQNLVEAHVLSAIRRQHAVRLDAVRKAIEYLRRAFGSQHPLADQQMFTDGKDLFVDKYGTLISASRAGQTATRQALELHLRRIDRDPGSGVPIRLWPFSKPGPDGARTIVIDPTVQFGRPCIAGTGIPTAIIRERMKAGESIAELVDDYGVRPEDVEEALRYELVDAA